MWRGNHSRKLTHNWHFHGRQLRWHWPSNWYLQRCDIKGRHIILAASLVVIVDDILAHIVIGTRIFDMRFTATIVYDEHQDEYCE